MIQKICVDLCSGLGGFSQAFVDDPDWFVVRIDITKKSGVNIIADVKNLPLKENLCLMEIDLLTEKKGIL